MQITRATPENGGDAAGRPSTPPEEAQHDELTWTTALAWFGVLASAASIGGLILGVVLGLVTWRQNRATTQLIANGHAATQLTLKDVHATTQETLKGDAHRDPGHPAYPGRGPDRPRADPRPYGPGG